MQSEQSTSLPTRWSGDDEAPGLRQLREIALPRFKHEGRPFLLIYRLAEPSNTTHALYKQDPGPANAALESIEAALKAADLFDTTDIVVAAEQVLARVAKVSATSRARSLLPRDKHVGTLPPGFLAIDITAALQEQDPSFGLFDPDRGHAYVDWDSRGHPAEGNGIIAEHFEPSQPYVTIEAHGVYDSIYLADSLSRQERRATARLIVATLLKQDYLGGVFVDEARLGGVPGALAPTYIAGKAGDGKLPDIVVSFDSSNGGCARPVTCTSVTADTRLMEGEAIPSRMSRTGTWTFMAARGPDFQRGLIDRLPASNADITRTIAELLHLDTDLEGGRVLIESLACIQVSHSPAAQDRVLLSKPSTSGFITQLRLQFLGRRSYFDSAASTHDDRVAQNEGPGWQWHLPRPKSVKVEISGGKD